MKYEVTSPDGKRFEVTAPDGATEAEILAYAQRRFSAVEPHKPNSPTEGIGIGRTLLEGIGKGYVDIGRAAKQIVGLKSADEVAEDRKYDAPLMDTVSGQIGNAIGSIATAAVPAMMAPSVAGAAAVGAGLGALQPVTAEESRLQNAAMGGALGGASQWGLGKLAGMAGKRLASAEASGAAQAAQNSARDQTLQVSKQAGYVIPPSQSGGGLTARALEGLSGKYKTNQAASIKNQNVTDRLARQAVGLGDDEPLTREAMRAVRARAYQEGYEPVASVGRIKTDDAYMKAIDGIVEKYEGAAKDFPGAASDAVSKFVAGTGKPGTPGKSVWVDEMGNVVDDVVEPVAPKLRSLLDEVKKSGGISTSEVAEIGVHDLHKARPGLLRKGDNGNSADSLAEWMGQNGWLSREQMRYADENLTGGSQELAKDLLRSALNGERVVHPAQADAWYAYTDAMEQIGKNLRRVEVPGEPGMPGGLRVPEFDAANGLRMTQKLRDEAGEAFAKGDKALGKAKREAAAALEDQIERALQSAGKDGAELLKRFREARTKMAKAHNVEKAIVEAGGHVNAKVLGAALQRGKPLSDELKTIGAFANNFKDVAKVPESGWANPFTIFDFGVGAFGAPQLPLARVAARSAILGPMQKGMKPEYGPGLLTRKAPPTLEELRRLGFGGLLGSAYAVQQ